MATKNPIAQIYRIMKVPQIPCVKSSLQNCMGQVNQDRVGVIQIGFDVPENPYFTRVFGFLYFCGFGFATLLQHANFKSFLQQMKSYKAAVWLIAHLNLLSSIYII